MKNTYRITNTFIYTGEKLEAIDIQFHPVNSFLMDSVYPKACFSNAQMIAEVLECEYVEGEVVLHHSHTPISLIHAWNSIDGVHFDPTWQKYPPAWDLGFSYFPAVSGTVEEIIRQGYTFNSPLDILTQYWRKTKNTRKGI